MFEKDDAGKKFLLNMTTSLIKEKFLVRLSDSKYNLTVKIIKTILSSTLKKQFPKELKAEKVLELIVRLSKTKSNQSVVMCKEFKDSVFWKDIDLWVNIFRLLNDREEKRESSNKRRSVKGKGLKGFFNTIMAKANKSPADEIKKKIQEVGPNPRTPGRTS
jgi:hypothetical protein